MIGRISSPRFVGRQEELAALERLVARAAAGSGGGVVEDAAALEGLSDPLRAALAALWPTAGGAPAAGGREQLFEAVHRVLARVAQARPVLLIVEDVHWIDASSRDLLAFLVRNARHDPIAVVVSYRPDELHRGHPL